MLPTDVGAQDEVTFLIGYAPSSLISLEPPDAELLAAWQRALGKLYRWAATWDPDEASRNDELESWKDELLDLVDEIDVIVTPRMILWHEIQQATAGEGTASTGSGL